MLVRAVSDVGCLIKLSNWLMVMKDGPGEKEAEGLKLGSV